jgi:MoaA/NifB/PqqE/SkfB family radical SAM enzyme
MLQISPLYSFVNDKNEKRFSKGLARHEYRRAVHKILAYAKRGYPVFYSRRNYVNILNWPVEEADRIFVPEHGFEHIRCYAGRYFCMIEANGDMFPCVPFSRQSASNCLHDGVEQAFTNMVRPRCAACIWACYNETNLLLDLNPGVIWHTLKNALRSQFA